MKPDIPTRVEALAVAEDKTALYLHGVVGGWYDEITTDSVRRALAGVTGGEVEVHINSYGGDMFEGIAIKNYLIQHPAKVTVVIDGLAASAASIIAMGGDTILMPRDTQLMIHNPWTFAAGNAKELRKVADDLDKSQTSIEETYLKRFKGERSELQALLDEETFLTAEEAVALGLADGIFDDQTTEEAVDASGETVLDHLMAKYGPKDTDKQAGGNIERFAFLFAPTKKGD